MLINDYYCYTCLENSMKPTERTVEIDPYTTLHVFECQACLTLNYIDVDASSPNKS